MSMTLAEYDAIREERSRFVLLRGHERPAAERVAGPPPVPLAPLAP